MAILIQCPACTKRLRVPDDLLGKMVKCPTCQTQFAGVAEPTANMLKSRRSVMLMSRPSPVAVTSTCGDPGLSSAPWKASDSSPASVAAAFTSDALAPAW